MLQQPPWFTDDIRELWTEKRRAQKAATRDRNNDDLKNQARAAAVVFEKAAKESKEKLYDDFAQAVSDDESHF